MKQIDRPGAGTDPQGLERNAANHTPLTPLDFLARTAQVFPDHTAGQRIRKYCARFSEKV